MTIFHQSHLDTINSILSNGVVAKRTKLREASIVIGKPDQPGAISLVLIEDDAAGTFWEVLYYPAIDPKTLANSDLGSLMTQTERGRFKNWNAMVNYLTKMSADFSISTHDKVVYF